MCTAYPRKSAVFADSSRALCRCTLLFCSLFQFPLGKQCFQYVSSETHTKVGHSVDVSLLIIIEKENWSIHQDCSELSWVAYHKKLDFSPQIAHYRVDVPMNKMGWGIGSVYQGYIAGNFCADKLAHLILMRIRQDWSKSLVHYGKAEQTGPIFLQNAAYIKAHFSENV